MSIRTKIEILKGDITKVTVDAIVNAANSSLLGGGAKEERNTKRGKNVRTGCGGNNLCKSV